MGVVGALILLSACAVDHPQYIGTDAAVGCVVVEDCPMRAGCVSPVGCVEGMCIYDDGCNEETHRCSPENNICVRTGQCDPVRCEEFLTTPTACVVGFCSEEGECQSRSVCPPSDDPCLLPDCNDSVCGTKPARDGTHCYRGDFCLTGLETCQEGVCVSPGPPCDAGACNEENENCECVTVADCVAIPDTPGTEVYPNECAIVGTVRDTRHTPRCNGTVCEYDDGLGPMRNVSRSSRDGLPCEMGGTCLSERCESCTDGIQNRDETDVDCGGAGCGPCLDGQMCLVSGDCVNGLCSLNTCVSCGDGRTNGTETDVDCGGSCLADCADGLVCTVGGDCMSGRCSSNICTSCADATMNGDETDVDCGGSCAACANGEMCTGDADCMSGRCTSNTCTSCSDTTMNGDETDVDCGGSCPTSCATGQMCMVASDCSSNWCSTSNTCSSCSDMTINGDETDVDCGGSCAACANGEMCTGDADCTSNRCTSNTCTSCFDSLMNGGEEGVDCGGPCAASCSSCGDGTVDMGEVCDDNNGDDGDGCSSACALESGYVCDATPRGGPCVGGTGHTETLSITIAQPAGMRDLADAVATGSTNAPAGSTVTVSVEAGATCTDDILAGSPESLFSCTLTPITAGLAQRTTASVTVNGATVTAFTMFDAGPCVRKTAGDTCGAGVCSADGIGGTCVVCIVVDMSAIDPGCSSEMPTCDPGGGGGGGPHCE